MIATLKIHALGLGVFLIGCAIGGGGAFAYFAHRPQPSSSPESRPSPTPTLFQRVDALVASGRELEKNNLLGAFQNYERAAEMVVAERIASTVEDFAVIELYDRIDRETRRLRRLLERSTYLPTIAADALSTEDRPLMGWNKSRGIEMRFGGHELLLQGVDVEGTPITGVASFGLHRAAPWHDVVLDLEFTILSGSFQLYLRYWPDKRSFMLSFDSRAGYEIGKRYLLSFVIKGDNVRMRTPDQNPQVGVLAWNTSRSGGVGFGLKAGSEVLISGCMVKVLW